MRALTLYIKFEEALFKTHLTTAFRDTYLMPIPPTIAGIFSSLLGIPRNNVYNTFKDYYFGAILLNYKGKSRENATLIQDKGAGLYISTIVPQYILNEPEYLLYMAKDGEEIEGIYDRVKDGIYYMPYGGQNDFFPLDFEVRGIVEVGLSKEVLNYAPASLVERTYLEEGGELYLSPVKYGPGNGCSGFEDFYFVYRGRLQLNRPVYNVDGSAIYKLSDFCYMGRK